MADNGSFRDERARTPSDRNRRLSYYDDNDGEVDKSDGCRGDASSKAAGTFDADTAAQPTVRSPLPPPYTHCVPAIHRLFVFDIRPPVSIFSQYTYIEPTIHYVHASRMYSLYIIDQSIEVHASSVSKQITLFQNAAAMIQLSLSLSLSLSHTHTHTTTTTIHLETVCFEHAGCVDADNAQAFGTDACVSRS